jgi:hypothetical protein
VFDIDLARAQALAEPLGAQAFDDMAAFLAAVDVVTVATPAVHHAKAGLAALKAGKPVYSEKPLAVTPRRRRRPGRPPPGPACPLACGHQERVVFQAMGLLDIPEQPLRLEAVRRGTPSDRNLDVSVVLDLMIHDIDLALALCDGEPVTVEGEGAVTRSTPDGSRPRPPSTTASPPCSTLPRRRGPRADHEGRLPLRRGRDRLSGAHLPQHHPVPADRGLHRNPGRQGPPGSERRRLPGPCAARRRVRW